MALIAGNAQGICDSCRKPIQKGEHYRRIRIKDPKPKSFAHSRAIRNSLPRYRARHADCPSPEITVDCPKCFSPAGNPCITIHSFTGVERELKKSHKERELIYKHALYGKKR